MYGKQFVVVDFECGGNKLEFKICLNLFTYVKKIRKKKQLFEKSNNKCVMHILLCCNCAFSFPNEY